MDKKENKCSIKNEAQRIGKIMKELRTIKGWSQSQVAQMLDMPLTTYNAYELGSNRQHGELIVKLANLYNVTTDRVLGYESSQYLPYNIILIGKDNIRQVYEFDENKFNCIKNLIEEIKKLNS